MAESTTPDRDREHAEPLLGEKGEVPVGGEGGPIISLADHTPEEVKQGRDERKPLLGEDDDVHLGGEGGPIVSLADHTPEEVKRGREKRPLLDD
jgi:hypothetical protein